MRTFFKNANFYKLWRPEFKLEKKKSSENRNGQILLSLPENPILPAAAAGAWSRRLQLIRCCLLSLLVAENNTGLWLLVFPPWYGVSS